MPSNGYTEIVEKILDHSHITVHLNSNFEKCQTREFAHVFYSGPIDGYFEYCLGNLGYRTLDFEEIRGRGDYQGCAVMNYGDESIPYTRITEHKYFAPWETHENTVCYAEYSRQCVEGDIPYYPIRLLDEQSLLKKYVELAQRESNISFVGRLGTYRYLDMDVTIAEALAAVKEFLSYRNDKKPVPAFFVNPI